mmetsp:Transcript_44248/g.114973  ORF Transcript_44248/g.114973 Transcript_44248/m.114973 type:complete len:107 (-) Transcript_44248:1300-1620(-)
MGSFFSSVSQEQIQAVKKMISSDNVVVFSKTYCPFCTTAKGILEAEAPKVYELNRIREGEDIQAALASITSQSTVPNIFIGGQHIGGCSGEGTSSLFASPFAYRKM